MKPTTIITLLAAWIWAFQGCDNKSKTASAAHDARQRFISTNKKEADISVKDVINRKVTEESLNNMQF